MRQLERTFLQLLGLFVVVRFVLFFINAPNLWGINELHYLPIWLAISLTAIPLLAFNAKFGNRPLAPKSQKRSSPKKKTRRSSLASVVILSVLVLGVLFVLVQVAWPFLGDGTAYAGFIYNFEKAGTTTTQKTAAAVMYLLYGIYYLSRHVFSADPHVFLPFTVLDCVSGLIFAVSAFAFARTVRPDKSISWLLLALLFGCGGTLFFFGYVEMYALQYAFVLLYAYLSYRVVTVKRSLLPVGIVLLLCIASHLQNFLLIPSFILLVVLRSDSQQENSDIQKRVWRWGSAAVLILGAVYVASQMNLLGFSGQSAESPFIAFSPNPHSSYALFTGIHLLDIVNEHLLLAAVPLLLILSIVVFRFRTIRWNEPYLLFLMANIFFFEAFLIGGNFELGLGRDWDVSASLGTFLALFAYVLFQQSFAEAAAQKRLAIPTAVVALSSVVMYITVNTGTAAAVNRFEDLLHIYSQTIDPVQTNYGYENLRKYYDSRQDVNGAISIERSMMQAHPTPVVLSDALSRIKTDGAELSQQSIADIQQMISEVGNITADSLLLQEVFDKVRLGPPHQIQSITLADLFEDGVVLLCEKAQVLSVADAFAITDAFIAKHPNIARGYELRGSLSRDLRKDVSGAITDYEKAVSLDSLRPHLYFYLAEAYRSLGKLDSALANYRKLVHVVPAFMGGLQNYLHLLVHKPQDVADTIDCILIRHCLTDILSGVQDSSMNHNPGDRENAILLARQFLPIVDQQLVKLQTSK